jgi:hypothetical protein
MRILHVDTSCQMRGGQWQALLLAEGLAHEGHQSVVMAPRDSPLAEKAEARGLEVRALGWVALARHSVHADLVHAHDARGHTMAAMTAQAPVVVSRRVAFPVRSSLLSLWKYSRPRHYLAVSRYVRATLIQAAVPESKITVVYDGVAVRKPHGGGTAIIAPSTEDPAKGSDLVRESARIAGLDVRFSVNLEPDLDEAMMMVYITRQEGLGSAALMAMAAGVPVIASRVGGLPEVVEDGTCGLLTENDPAEIARAMMRLASDAALRARLGSEGWLRAGRRFSLENMVHGTLDVYRRVLSC